MKFQVPQFIEIEDKIFGPLTFKQAIYMVGSFGMAFALWSMLSGPLAFILSIPVAALGFALAFYKVNNRPFVNVLESAFLYVVSSRLYVWKKKEKAIQKKKEIPKEALTPYVPKVSESKLKDLAWSLDIKESIYSDREQQK